ncbi:MAG: hypothetical protein HQL87_16500 [Magnetococcales bacterium]|nr:hypothetical protein [Magnetococcales bacterium]
MTTAERIYVEAKRLPEHLASEVLNFILEIEQRNSVRQRGSEGDTDRAIHSQEILRLARVAQASFPVVEQGIRDREFAALRNEWDRLS